VGVGVSAENDSADSWAAARSALDYVRIFSGRGDWSFVHSGILAAAVGKYLAPGVGVRDVELRSGDGVRRIDDCEPVLEG